MAKVLTMAAYYDMMSGGAYTTLEDIKMLSAAGKNTFPLVTLSGNAHLEEAQPFCTSAPLAGPLPHA